MDTYPLCVRKMILLIGVIPLISLTGCKALTGIQAVPVNRVPQEILARPKEDAQQISISRLRQDAPPEYLLGPNDVLGVYIENVLGQEGTNPPVHFPQTGDQPPALGFPVPIREDGTIQLPFIPPLKLNGQTLTQASDTIRDAYLSNQILQPQQTKIIVTLIRRRAVRVTVIREEGGDEMV